MYDRLTPADAALIRSLHPALRAIVEREVEAGNGIRDISTGWPKPTSIVVAMQAAFLLKHGAPGVVHHTIKDPHYWYAEYSNDESGQLIVCPFPRD